LVEKRRTDRRIQRTQELVRQAFLSLVTERGYASLTIDDITERANVGRSTFYLHFSDKEHLLASTIEAFFGKLAKEIQEHPSPLTAEQWHTRATTFFKHVAENQPMYRLILASPSAIIAGRMRKVLMNNAKDYLATCWLKGRDDPVLTDLLANHLVFSVMSFCWWWMESATPHTCGEVANLFKELTTRGIAGVIEAARGKNTKTA